MISRYEVLFSEDGNLDKSREEMTVVAHYFPHYFEHYSDKKAAAFRAARNFCDRWKVEPEKRHGGKEVVYENGSAYALLDGFDYGCDVYVKDIKGEGYVKYRRHQHKLSFHKNIGEINAWNDAILFAKELCDRLASREVKRCIDEEDYPDCPYGHWGFGGILGGVVFFLFWIGVAIKSNHLFGAEGFDFFSKNTHPFSPNGLAVLLEHWWQVILLVALSALIGIAFWGLSRTRKFSIAYRVFVGTFGKAQAICTGLAWGVVGLYWTIIGLWRSIIRPIPDALGYPHFIVATIYLAVIVWGIVDFMKHRKRFPGNFSINNIGTAS